jgi:photosystem II stability/assembly factor-like uncharacterized protein
MWKRITPIIFFSFLIITGLSAQKKKKGTESDHPLEKLDVNLKFRSIGPALTSGRISDFAVVPHDHSTYYVATSSGGVWKTVNAGTTYEPIFDSQGSYSIGCVTIDPNNPNTVWVGTGENNNQRSVAYGDGIYKSNDGGKEWQHMGLNNSEHIGKIIVHPENSNVIWVAAIGPLWSSGGDRGAYKSTDGGKTWRKVLSIDKYTGVNDIVMDPRNPDILYASAYQRARHVFTYLGGGPGSGIYKSFDGGESWEKVNKGLPEVDMGRIGLGISPADPDIIYAIVEAADDKSGLFRTTDGAASWHKRGKYVTSGNYYQELVLDPKDADIIYAMDTWMHYSKDGGKTFSKVGEVTKHVDNHCMWINPDNTSHWIVGCDGGIYDTWDKGKTWLYRQNLPVTQFYKVSVDNAEPFYNIYGGTQDNFSMGGPSRTNSGNGILNTDWFITHGGDGFETQVDPNDENIIYAQSQYGVLARYDRRNGEELGIQPTERKGEAAYRWNWDAPLVISEHNPSRLYFAANKVFRTDDQGNSWDVISDDLTAQINRNQLKIMDRVWGIDAIAKNGSTSPYGTIVAFVESPINESLLFAGTDDGLIQITNDGGNTWQKMSSFPGVPSPIYVNAIIASQHNEQVVYAAFNHHKYGDFKPYLLKSMDKGRSWTSISNNLPGRGSVYSIAEDHEDPNLLFAGTEFGVFFSSDGGKFWKQLKKGVPTVAVRDIAIQKRENDLVLGTFGRGFYVLDDYSPLRGLGKRVNEEKIGLISMRDPVSFEYSYPLGIPGKGFQGDHFYTGDNLGAVAMFTYWLDEKPKTPKEERKDKEKALKKDKKDVAYPSYEALKKERESDKPALVLVIKDADGNVVRNVKTKMKKGLNRFTWDLRYSDKHSVSIKPPGHYSPWADRLEGTLVSPGNYRAGLYMLIDGNMTQMGDDVTFTVNSLNNVSIPRGDNAEKLAFQNDVNELFRRLQIAQGSLNEVDNQIKHIEKGIQFVENPIDDLWKEIREIKAEMRGIKELLNGDAVASKLDIDKPVSVSSRIGKIMYEQKYSTAAPSKTHMDSYVIAKEEFEPLVQRIKSLTEQRMNALHKKLDTLGVPYTPGRGL